VNSEVDSLIEAKRCVE